MPLRSVGHPASPQANLSANGGVCESSTQLQQRQPLAGTYSGTASNMVPQRTSILKRPQVHDAQPDNSGTISGILGRPVSDPASSPDAGQQRLGTGAMPVRGSAPDPKLGIGSRPGQDVPVSSRGFVPGTSTSQFEPGSGN